MKKKKKDGTPRWCEWVAPDGTIIPAVPCGSIFKDKKDKLKTQRLKELREFRKEYT